MLLVAEPSPVRREVVRRLHAEDGLAAHVVSSAAEALDWLGGHCPRVVIVGGMGEDPSDLLCTVRERRPEAWRVLLVREVGCDVVMRAVNRAGVHRVELQDDLDALVTAVRALVAETTEPP